MWTLFWVILSAIVVGGFAAWFDEPSEKNVEKTIKNQRSASVLSTNVTKVNSFPNLYFSNEGKQLWFKTYDEATNEPKRVRFDLTVGKNCDVNVDDLSQLMDAIALRFFVYDGGPKFDTQEAKTVITETHGLTVMNGGIRVFKP